MKRPRSLERVPPYRGFRWIYDRFIRSVLPSKVGVYNGVPVRDRGLFDITDESPEYEAELIDGVEREIEKGDSVIVLGGGRGVSAVVAARAAGPSGAVTVFEAGVEQYDLVQDTVQLNQVADRASVRHAVVGEAIHLWGSEDQEVGDTIHPKELPECDVLVSDCEGAELDVLEAYPHRPRSIVVETHGHLGAPEDTVRNVLQETGYSVVNQGVEKPDDGIVIFSARYDDSTQP